MEAPARVTIKTRNGKVFVSERKYPIGSVKEPLTVEQFRGLYHKFTRGILADTEISRTADAILHLEDLSDTRELMNTLVFQCRGF
jgi:hypothetical protein